MKRLLLSVGLTLSLLFLVASAAEESTQHSNEAGSSCHPETVSGEVKIASLRVEEVKVPLIFTFFIILVVLCKMGWHHSVMHLISSNFPESCMLIIVGTHIGGILVAAFRLDSCNEGNVLPFRFTPELFFIFLLPPIIFSSGYFLDNRAFFENIVSILVFAVIGTIWNAFALGFTLYGFSVAGWTTSSLSISSALLFGTICAAVDPVAVLAVFDEIHVNKLLHILVFGESLLNDAVTIVLFQVLGAFANKPFDDTPDAEDDIAVDIVLGFVQFFVVIIASILIGVIFGFTGSFLSRFTHHIHVLEPVLLFAVGYLSYLLADLFAFSGIVSLIVCAMLMKHYVPPNIAWKSNITFKYCLKMISVVAEMIIFLYLGLSLFDVDVHKWDTGLVLLTLVFAFIFRPIGTVALAVFVNFFRFHKINVRQMFIMSYSGLRGAVAFSLALTRLFEEGYDNLPLQEQDVRKSMLTAVTTLLLFTVFVQGTTIKPWVKLIGVKIEKTHTETMNEVIHSTAIDHINSGIQDIAGTVGFNRILEILHYIDVTYLRRIFERFPDAVDREITTKFRSLQFKDSTQAAGYVRLEEGEHGTDLNVTEPPSTPCTPSLEDAVPVLDEIFRANRSHPHEDHLMHVLSRDAGDEKDHHLQKIKLKHRIRHRTAREKHTSKILRRHTTGATSSTSKIIAKKEREPEHTAEEMVNMSPDEAEKTIEGAADDTALKEVHVQDEQGDMESFI